jgi:DNA polymerase III delta prime subunit
MLLQTDIEEWQAAIVRNESRYTGARAKAHANFEKEIQYIAKVDHRDTERAIRIVQFLEALVNAIPGTNTAVDILRQQEHEKTNEEVQCTMTRLRQLLIERISGLRMLAICMKR